MRPKVPAIHQAIAFERVLEALEMERVDATDDELLEAARDLGMDPSMRGSAAFIGLKNSDALRKLSPSDFNRFKIAIEQAIERGDLPITHFNRIVTEHSSPASPGSETPPPPGPARAPLRGPPLRSPFGLPAGQSPQQNSSVCRSRRKIQSHGRSCLHLPVL